MTRRDIGRRTPRVVSAMLVAAAVQATLLILPAGAGTLGLAVFVPTAPMLLPTGAGSTTTALLDGSVLVAGGTGDVTGTGLASGFQEAERYMPSSQRWLPAGTMRAQRQFATAARLGDGRVLVVGGDFTFSATTAEIYSPTSNSWSAAASLPATVTGEKLASALLGDGRVLVTAGAPESSPPQSSTFTWSPGSNTWTQIAGGPMPDATLTALAGGDVLATGGIFNCGCSPVGPVESSSQASIFRMATNLWVSAAFMPSDRVAHAAVLLPSGRVLVAGGYTFTAAGTTSSSRSLTSAALYDPTTGTWSATGAMSQPRDTFGAALVPGTSQVVVVGGYQRSSLLQRLASAELYDASDGRWTSAGRLIDPVGGPGVAGLPGGGALAAGGDDAVLGETVQAEQLLFL